MSSGEPLIHVHEAQMELDQTRIPAEGLNPHSGLHMTIAVFLGFKYPRCTSTVHLIFAGVRHVVAHM